MSRRVDGPAEVPARRHPADVVVRDVAERAELEDVRRLLARIWTRPDGSSPVPLEVLRAVVCAGSMALGAFRAGELVGAAVGFVGYVDGRAHLHSHIVGVHPAAQGQGIGRAIKWRQRSWCLERGIEQVSWTFDPLVRRNVWFNTNTLGAFGTRYYEDFYGPMPDGLNAGLPTDRCLAVWDLDSARVTAAARGELTVPDLATLLGQGAQVVLSVDEHGGPSRGPVNGGDAPARVLQVPADVTALLRTRPEHVLRWRLALRAAMKTATRDGLGLAAVTGEGWYVLWEGAGG